MKSDPKVFIPIFLISPIPFVTFTPNIYPCTLSSYFKLVDDDLLKIGIKKSKVFPSKYFISWHNKIQFPNDSLYFFYSPTKYAELIEHIQSQLTEEEWKKYKEGHDDLIKIYKELNENSNTIIGGLKFK